MSSTEIATNRYTHDPHVQLMLRVREGSDDAFTKLVNLYQDRLIGIFTPMLGEKTAAEDLAQEVFLRIYRARRGYEPTAKFSTWIFRIANNLASNTRRNKGRRKEVSLTGPGASTPSGPSAVQRMPDKSGLMPTRQVDRKEMQQFVRNALDDLGERQKMAVLLNKFEGMSYNDIADSLEITVPAVKSLLARAREKLRTQLEEYVSDR